MKNNPQNSEFYFKWRGIKEPTHLTDSFFYEVKIKKANLNINQIRFRFI